MRFLNLAKNPDIRTFWFGQLFYYSNYWHCDLHICINGSFPSGAYLRDVIHETLDVPLCLSLKNESLAIL